MEFTKTKQIQDWLLSNGFFISKKGNKYRFNVKTGDDIKDIRELNNTEVSFLSKIIVNHIINPFVDISDFKKFFTTVDLLLIQNYKKRETELKNLERKSRVLKGSKAFVYCKKENKYFKIQRNKFKFKGVFQLDYHLIPEGEEIHSFNDYAELMAAYEWKDTPNRYSEEYEKQKKIFDEIGLCKW